MDNQHYSHKDGVTSRLRATAGAAVVAMSLYLAPAPADAVIRPDIEPQVAKHEFRTESRSIDSKALEDAIHHGVEAFSVWLRSWVPYVHNVGRLYANEPQQTMESIEGMMPAPGAYVIKSVLADEAQAKNLSLQDVVDRSPMIRSSEPGHAYWARRGGSGSGCHVRGAHTRYEPGGLTLDRLKNGNEYVFEPSGPGSEFWSQKENAFVPCVDPLKGIASWYKDEFVK